MRAAFVLGLVAVFALVVGVQAADKEVKVTGNITCAKCELKKEEKCTTVVVAKEGGKDVVYYFDAKAHKDNHEAICKKGKEGTVTGTVAEKDGKKTITVTKVEFK